MQYISTTDSALQLGEKSVMSIIEYVKSFILLTGPSLYNQKIEEIIKKRKGQIRPSLTWGVNCTCKKVKL